jgi:hypothetical protein
MTWIGQYLRLARSKEPNRADVSDPSSEDGNRSSFRNMVFPSCVEFRTMDKAQKPSLLSKTSVFWDITSYGQLKAKAQKPILLSKTSVFWDITSYSQLKAKAQKPSYSRRLQSFGISLRMVSWRRKPRNPAYSRRLHSFGTSLRIVGWRRTYASEERVAIFSRVEGVKQELCFLCSPCWLPYCLILYHEDWGNMFPRNVIDFQQTIRRYIQ